MEGTLKKGVALLVVLFLGFYLFTDPHGFAAVAQDATGKAWDGLVQFFRAIIDFLDALSG